MTPSFLEKVFFLMVTVLIGLGAWQLVETQQLSNSVARIDQRLTDYQVAAEISLPPGFHLVKCEPQLFDVTVK